MTKIEHISCVMIVKNAEATLQPVLEALEVFEDVVLYSNNSTDRTDEIANSFSNVNLIQGDFLGFGPTKNRATEYAKNEWILSLDADEVLSPAFTKNLVSLELNKETIYSILRTNYYKKQEIKHCWGDDIIPRLYNRAVTRFTDKQVHEKIITDSLKQEMLLGSVQHYPYASISDFIVKLDRYSSIFAEDNKGKKNSSPLKAFFNGLFSFTKTYIFKRGFLDGYAGLVIAFSHMATNFYKYIKLYELNQDVKERV